MTEEVVWGLGAVRGEIPAASAGMTEKGCGYDGERGAGVTEGRGYGGGGGLGLGCCSRRDTRGKRGYDGRGARV